MRAAQLGDRVRVQYSRISPSGRGTDKRPGRKTCEFVVGGTEVFPTLSTGVVGMSPGNCKQLLLQPLEAYGKVQRKLIRRVSRQHLPPDLVVRVGMQLATMDPISGRRRRVKVIAVQPDCVLVDGNHPLAGTAIQLEVKLLSLNSIKTTDGQQPQSDVNE